MSSPSRATAAPPRKQLVSTLALCVFTAALSAFTFGFHLGEVNQPRQAMSNCAAADRRFSAAGLPDCIPMDDWAWGTFVSLFLLGGTAGALSGGALVQRLGRRRLLLAANAPYLLAALLLATGGSRAALFAGRAAGGLGAGLATVAVPLYIAEVAPVRIRGRLGAVNQLAVVVGILASQTVGIPLSTRATWRYLFACGAVSPLVQCLLLPFCVESPRWLSANGLMSDARHALKKLRADSGASDGQIEDELEAMLDTSGTSRQESTDDNEGGLIGRNIDEAPLTAGSNHQTVSITELFFVKALRRPLMACIGLQVSQQLSGINAAVFYSTTIFNQSYSPEVAVKLSLLVSVMNLVMTVFSLSFIEKLGRKTLVLASELGMMCCGLLIYISIKIDAPSLVVVGLMGFVGFFGVGLGAIPWLILPELVPGYAVNSAASVCSGVNWGSGLVVAFFLPAVIGYLGYDVFLVFSILLAGFAYFTSVHVPETKGMTPEEVARVNHF
ncbi:general substrate transporter [Obelidium mucronatum]|nr:general substrate transporter [Obelidium mucronatum]